MKRRMFGRRKGVSCTKFGVWNKRFIGTHQLHSSEKSKEHHDILMKVVKQDQLFRPAVERMETELIVSAMEVIRPMPHKHLVDIDTPAECLFIVLEGTVECSECGHGKKPAMKLKVGQYFGDESLLWHSNWTFTAEAGPTCVLGKMARTCYNHVVVEKGMEE